MKIRPVGAGFHVEGWTDGRIDRQTDMKLIIVFRNLRTRLKRLSLLEHSLFLQCETENSQSSPLRGSCSSVPLTFMVHSVTI